MRAVIWVFALLLVLIGASQVIAPGYWVGITRDMLGYSWLRFFGFAMLVVGVVVVAATARRLVGLRPFMLIFGMVVTAGGLWAALNPDMVVDFIYAIFLNRSYGFQLLLARISGLVRVLLGIAVVYALLKPPTRANAVAPR